MTPKQMEVSLRDYVDTRIKALEDRFTGIDRSTDLATNTATSIVTQIRTENDARWTAHLLVTDVLEKRISAMEQGKLNVGAHEALDIRIQAIEKAQAKSGQQRFSAGQLAAAAMTVALATLAMELTTIILFISHILHS